MNVGISFKTEASDNYIKTIYCLPSAKLVSTGGVFAFLTIAISSLYIFQYNGKRISNDMRLLAVCYLTTRQNWKLNSCGVLPK